MEEVVFVRKPGDKITTKRCGVPFNVDRWSASYDGLSSAFNSDQSLEAFVTHVAHGWVGVQED